MIVYPVGILRQPVVDERRLQRVLLRIRQIRDDHASKRARTRDGFLSLLYQVAGMQSVLRRLDQRHFVRILRRVQLLADTFYLFARLVLALPRAERIAPEDPEVNKESIAHRHAGQLAGYLRSRAGKTPESQLESFHEVVIPRLAPRDARDLAYLMIRALLGALDPVYRRRFEELHELSIRRLSLEHLSPRHQPRDIRSNHRHLKEPADRDTLVSLQHIEPVQILIHPDRAVEPLSHLSLVQIAPLRGKLSFRRQQRHEIGRE